MFIEFFMYIIHAKKINRNKFNVNFNVSFYSIEIHVLLKL